MACNASGHTPNCLCGFGGVGTIAEAAIDWKVTPAADPWGIGAVSTNTVAPAISNEWLASARGVARDEWNPGSAQAAREEIYLLSRLGEESFPARSDVAASAIAEWDETKGGRFGITDPIPGVRADEIADYFAHRGRLLVSDSGTYGNGLSDTDQDYLWYAADAYVRYSHPNQPAGYTEEQTAIVFDLLARDVADPDGALPQPIKKAPVPVGAQWPGHVRGGHDAEPPF